jgi:tetratricopeptide (TPR) repeat protein
LGVDPALIDAMMQGKDLMFQRRYSEALNHFDNIQNNFPESVGGFFGKMAVWQVRMFENDDFRFKSKYEVAEKEYDKFTTRQLRKGDVPPWELFVHGAADGMRGFFKGRQGKWFRALSHGMHAMRMFKQLKWKEPNFVDTDLGFGMYKFWRSVFTNELKILPFFSDARAEGVALVKKVATSGKYATDLAIGNLVFIYGQENQHDKAIAAANQILAKFPNNLIMKYQKGRNYLWAKRYDEALATFEDVYNSDPAITKALLQQGIALYKKKEYDGSRLILEKFIAVDKEKEYLAIAYYWLGRIAENNKDKETAMVSYKKSLSFHKLKASNARLKKLQTQK